MELSTFVLQVQVWGTKLLVTLQIKIFKHEIFEKIKYDVDFFLLFIYFIYLLFIVNNSDFFLQIYFYF